LTENGVPSRCDVLHVLWAGYYGGIQTQLATLVRAFDGRPGLTHRVCFLEGTGPIADGLVAEGLAFRLGMRRGWDPRDLGRFARSLRQARPSVVHVHSPVLGPALVATSGTGATRVFTQHGLRTEKQNRIFFRLLGRRFDRFLVAAPGLASRLEGYGVAADRIGHLPLPLTVPARVVPDREGSNGRPVVGLVARLEREKRVDVFIDVIDALRAKGADCAGVIVGDGSLRRELEAQAHSRGLDGHVQVLGIQEDHLAWLDGFDVCLMTSERDVYPLVAIEAMARGVPLVAMPCDGGLPDLATRGGLLLPDRDPSTAATALIGLFESAEQRADLRARGAAVAAQHAVENVIPVYEAFYEGLRRRRETAG
jgi:glycosyltransferase involved in cell wall biosynthesis